MSGNAQQEIKKLYDVPNELPGEVSDLLIDLRRRESEDPSLSKETNAYLAALHDEGWSLRALANAFGGVTFQAVNFRIKNAKNSGVKNIHPVPKVPVKERVEHEEVKPRGRRRYVIPAEIATEMKKLAPMAKQFRGTTPPNHPNALAAHRLTELMAQERKNGATFKQIGEAAGISWSAVKFRLGRYGFEELPPTQSDTLLTELQVAPEETSEQD